MDQIAEGMQQTSQATTALAAGAQGSQRAIARVSEVGQGLEQVANQFRTAR